MEEFTLDELIEMCPSGAEIWEEVEALGRMLLEKNIKYGDSALSPINIFSGLSAKDRIAVRKDDKLARIREQMLMDHSDDEDPEWGLAGYILLDRVRRKQERALRQQVAQ